MFYYIILYYIILYYIIFYFSFNIFEPRIEIIELNWHVRYYRHLTEVWDNNNNNDEGEQNLKDKYDTYDEKEKVKKKYVEDEFNTKEKVKKKHRDDKYNKKEKSKKKHRDDKYNKKEKSKKKYVEDKFNKKNKHKENDVSLKKDQCKKSLSIREDCNNKNSKSYNEKEICDNENCVNLEDIKIYDNTTWKYKIKKLITCSYNSDKDAKVLYNWKLGKSILGKMINSTEDFSINGISYKDWTLNTIPDIGYSQNNRRSQEVFKTEVKSKDENTESVKLFIKKVPASIWVRQYIILNEHKGEYSLGEENFVMEAISLAFLNKYYPGIAPKFYGILYESPDKPNDNVCFSFGRGKCNNLKKFNDMLINQLQLNNKANVIMISELYGEDVFKYVKNKRKEGCFGNNLEEKKKILHESLKLITTLHETGLSHLDISPENILIGNNCELKLCDFANSAPIYTYNNRHLKGNKRLRYYESYQPCISKVPLLPPECWNIVRIHEKLKINDPYDYLKSITNQEERKSFYFNVSNADKFMLGIFFIWVWNNNYIWEKADSFNDRKFRNFVKCGMDLYNYELTYNWPDDLKDIINQLLPLENRAQLSLKELCKHPWWSN
ncbi:serine/threonine protein kinase [Plasmodium falciparum CAMP/Malaysia]|uniref:non-specific serine/threonine protein kinase n=1 Tax=Plasmodium falciparum (isolate Camp / Malaysia) TaxID=5835 RepID=A0A024XCF9_PLAFC|nr:serine/threonine protein kinase [Plasmodium falciparum CAMP/Malaysia]